MKTIQQHLETLKEPYKTQAINQTSKERLSYPILTLKASLKMSFDWEYSEEGFNYWWFAYENIEEFIDNQ